MFGNEESSDLNLQQVTMDEELDVEVGEDENGKQPAKNQLDRGARC